MNFFSWFRKQNNSTAISFDNGQMRYVSVTRHEGIIDIADYGSIDISDVADERGTILNDTLFVKKLVELRNSKKGKEIFNHVNIVVPDHQAIMFHSHVTKESPKQMDMVIVDHIKTYLQAHQLLSLTEYICEYDIIQETDFGYDIYVTLVPQVYMRHMVRLFHNAGIKVRHIETAHHSIASSCSNSPTGSGYVSIMIGLHTTTIALIHEDHLVSQERVFIGINHLIKTIQNYLSVDEKTARQILQKHGLLGTHPDTGLLGELHMAMAPVWRSIDKQLIEHAQRPYKIFGHRFSVTHSIVYGEGVTIKGIPAFLEQKTGLACSVLDVWQGRNDIRAPIVHLPSSETCIYAEALSLALVYLK